MSTKTVITDTTKVSLITSLSVIVANTATSLILPAIGFTKGGIAAGTFAAGTHSTIGIVAAGSKFAFCQKIGALGFGILGPYAIPVALGTGVVFGGIALVKHYKK